jgi:iron(III) transport system substrate-binding protein
MFSTLIRRRWAAAAAIAVAAVLAVAACGGGSAAGQGGNTGGGGPVEVNTAGVKFADKLVVYNGRSHTGGDQVFHDFEDRTGVEIELRGGTSPELFERLRQEGQDTPADLLVTVDLANLWRAEQAGLLQGVTSKTLQAQVPERLHDTGGSWWALSTRMRVPVVSTERVPTGAVTSYADLGNPKYQGRSCLRTSNNEYNQSLVADMIVKRGREATAQLLRSWMANNPKILSSDGELLAVMAAGDCDVGLSNHYYLARALKDNPDFPVAPAWPDQNAAGAHTNVSGIGVVRGSDAVPTAVALMEWLTSPPAQTEIVSRGEFAANPNVPPPTYIRDWANVKTDPINVEQAGPQLGEAVALMLEVGWR